MKVFVIIIFFAIIVNGQDGSLDTSFGNQGVVTSPEGWALGLKIQLDGKIVVAGSDSTTIQVTRYCSDGTLDSTFGINGVVNTQINGQRTFGTSLIIQNDSKILVGGFVKISTNNNGILLFRYNSNGALDNTFGNAGSVIADITTGNDYLEALELQDDGKIVICGDTPNGLFLSRYNPNGQIDNTFGVNGILITQIGNATISGAMAIQSDGKIIVTGEAFFPDTDILIIRYNADGSLDDTFGNDGIVLTSTGAYFEFGSSVRIQKDGKIIIGSLKKQIVGANIEIVVFRYLDNGILDNTFGNGGNVNASFGGIESYAWDSAIQSDQKIVIAGTTITDLLGNSGFGLLRINPDGTTDLTFGNSGIVVTPLGLSSEGREIEIQSDNKIVLTGWSSDRFTTARYNINSISPVEESQNDLIPSNIIIEQNYPNPFNPSTTIKFLITQASDAKLEVFNLLGEKISTLVDEYLNAGIYESEFYAKNLPSGIYLYKLNAGGNIKTKKMILMK